MTERPIVTNDGWGRKETFENFEEMFKCFFAERMKGYKLDTIIEKTAKTFVKNIFEEHEENIRNFIVNEMIKKTEYLKNENL